MALKIGQSFAQTTATLAAKSADLTMVKATDSYFVFNIGAEGFVIVSADDCYRPIVGYSDEGVFPVENPSPEMMYYLDNLSQGRQGALKAGLRQDPKVASEWHRLLAGQSLPSRNGHRASFHLVQTKWNQGDPYNRLCPTGSGGRCYAGCVATAMSQVMGYWQYPTQGQGQHSYTYGSYGVISADFASAEYDFSLMPVSISAMSPAENINAIAFFMFHCGVAVDMMYSPSGSGAYSEDVPEAILKYFGYTNRSRLVYRDQHTLADFQALLKDQFDLGWPVYYSGTDMDQNAGHAYVCDGYDDNDMFHFNWGWGGSGDGFFAIDELNVSGYAFNSGQAFVANYVPAEVFLNTAKAPSDLVATPNGDDSFSVTLSWTNPTATLDGHPLEGIDQIVVMRDGVTLQTFENPTPGEQMTYVDEAGLPVTVNYTVHAICNGYGGRRGHADGINLGPTCNWTVNLKSGQDTGWDGGLLTILNSSGVAVAELTATRGDDAFEVEVPLGRTSLRWTAPADSLAIGMELLDADGQTLFSYEGPSTLMPQGLFFETVNTCGGEGGTSVPSNLKAEVVDEDVVLQWDAADNTGYGYNIYRDGYFHTLVNTNTYTDNGAAQEMHSYFVTIFLPEGESDPSNTVSAVAETEVEAPSDLDFESLANGKVKLTWNAPQQAEELAGYQVYRRASGEAYKRVKILGANMTTYTDHTSLGDGDRYYYKVTAVHQRDNVESSPAHALQHPELHYVEINRTHIPTNLRLVADETQLLLQWDAPLLAETYNVYRNGERIAQDLVEPQYACEADGEPSFFQVTGLLNGVESSLSNKAFYAHYAVGETSLESGSVFPVPTNGLVTVKSEHLREVTVFSATGQQVLNRKVSGDELNIDLSGMDSGVYYFKMNTDQGTQVKKVVLVK